MTIRQILRTGAEALNENLPDNPRLEAEILLSFVLGKRREYLISHREEKIGLKNLLFYLWLLRKRRRGMPIAYITGHKEFYGYDLFVNKDVLIPRPESELIVEHALKMIAGKTGAHIGRTVLADIGTGSGCIAIALAREIVKSGFKDSVSAIYAVDASKRAIKTACRNAARHGLEKRIDFRTGSLLEPLAQSLRREMDRSQRLIITANLPYLTPGQVKNSLSISHEPRLALDGGPDGLKYYRRLWRQAGDIAYGFGSAAILSEIDETQGRAAIKLAEKIMPDSGIELVPDLKGLDRLIIIKINK